MSGQARIRGATTPVEVWLRVRQFPIGAGEFGQSPRAYAPGHDCDSYIRDASMKLNGEESVHFDVSSGIGACAQQEWAVVAWLAAAPDDPRPAGGARYGLTNFTIETCPLYPRDFCGTTSDVEVVIDQVAL